jgi:hypothetical protein
MVISKQTSIFFIVKDNTIVLLSLFDNRSNPDRLSFATMT